MAQSDRREFLLDNLKALGRLFTEAVDEALVGASGGKRYVRPPGALDEAAFLLTCTRCGECEKVCPTKAIRLLPPKAGVAVNTPYIDPLKSPCVLCGECMPVCKPGALLHIANPYDVRMGTAVVKEDRCWAHGGMPCNLCYLRCPFPDEAIQMVQGKPQIVSDLCTGCGQCAYACPSDPPAIHIEPRAR